MQVIKTFYKFFPSKAVIAKFTHSYVYRMDKVYVRCPAGSNVFDLSFQFIDSSLGLNRQFNFSRKIDESVDIFLSRVKTNLEKVINKKQKIKKELECKSNIQLLLDGEQVTGTELCKNVFSSNGVIHLKINDQEYQVLINAPWVKRIILPKSILANFPLYPAKLETVFADPELCEFEWFKSCDKQKWDLIGREFILYPKPKDVGYFLKVSCVPKNEQEYGPRAETQSECLVQADPGPCPFVTRHKFTTKTLSDKNLRVVSYNILADVNCDSDYSRNILYPYCAPYALQLDYRKQLILEELKGYNADILCLQEVDEKVFKYDLRPILRTLGFNGIFTKKYGNLLEGGACFFRRKRFQLLETNTLVYSQELSQNDLFTSIWDKVSCNTNLINRLKDRGAILQVAALKVVGLNKILLVANTHLYFHPDADHIRLLQAGMALIYIEHLMKKLTKQYYDKSISLIFCGDFNSVPSCGVYDLYTNGYVEPYHPDWSSNSEERVKGLCLTNSNLLASACGTPKFTNFTQDFKDCIDYIFYDPNKFTVTQVVPLLNYEALKVYTALPSIVVPSDHIALVADLQWID